MDGTVHGVGDTGSLYGEKQLHLCLITGMDWRWRKNLNMKDKNYKANKRKCGRLSLRHSSGIALLSQDPKCTNIRMKSLCSWGGTMGKEQGATGWEEIGTMSETAPVGIRCRPNDSPVGRPGRRLFLLGSGRDKAIR